MYGGALAKVELWSRGPVVVARKKGCLVVGGGLKGKDIE